MPNGAILVEEAPRFEFKNGLFYITGELGTRAMRPATFLQTLLLAEEAYAKWRLAALASDGNIVPFPR